MDKWRVSEHIRIRQPPRRVFDYLAHFHLIREWDLSVLSARMCTPGPPRIGSRFDLVLRFGLSRIPMTYEIVAMDAPRELVLHGTAQNFVATDWIRILPDADGCRLTYTAEVRFRRPWPPMLNKLLRGLFQSAARRAVARLQGMLSGKPRPPRLTPSARLADRTIIPGLIGFTRIGYHFAKKRRPVASILYRERVMVLTGGTSGIGLASAHELYRRGAHLVVVGRNAGKLDRLRARLAKRHPWGGRIETETADLSSLAETRQLAERLKQRLHHIDVLINNAGALFNTLHITPEGLERTMAVNLLAPYLLTHLLRPALENAIAPRIINVASGGMYAQALLASHVASPQTPYDGPTAYARAKRGLVTLTGMWADEWASRNISVHAMHPGWVGTPGLARALPAFYSRISPLLRTPAQGADTIVWLAASPDAQRASGQFWLDRKIRLTHVLPGTRTDARQEARIRRTLDHIAGFEK